VYLTLDVEDEPGDGKGFEGLWESIPKDGTQLAKFKKLWETIGDTLVDKGCTPEEIKDLKRLKRLWKIVGDGKREDPLGYLQELDELRRDLEVLEASDEKLKELKESDKLEELKTLWEAFIELRKSTEKIPTDTETLKKLEMIYRLEEVKKVTLSIFVKKIKIRMKIRMI
jgi:hypothetical protein